MADPNEPPTSVPPTSEPQAPSPIETSAERIAVDPEFQDDDGDSALGEDDNALSTASVNSAILEYRKMHGRTYHNFQQAEYWGPNDDQQNEGLDINHHMLYLALDNKLYVAPLENPQRVLDIGTGTGIWAMDFADEVPGAEVIGIDLSPTQPIWVPPNCRFELDDASRDWTFPDNHFDYIHIRFMLGCFKDWTKLYKECYRCLKPGGWLEHQEVSLGVYSDDDSIPPDSVWTEWANVFAEAGKRMGQTTEIRDDGNFLKWMKDAGFDNVQSKPVKVPMGGWPLDTKWKNIGQLNRFCFETSMEGYSMYLLTNVMGWEYAEVQIWLKRVRDALRNKKYHGYSIWESATAQKKLKE